MDLRLSCSLWVHVSRTSALMSYDDPCNCGQHIPVGVRVARARSPPLVASRACADVYGAVGGRVVWLVDWGGLMRCCLTYTLTPKPSSHASLATTDWAARC
jgi:hypothetical protein